MTEDEMRKKIKEKIALYMEDCENCYGLDSLVDNIIEILKEKKKYFNRKKEYDKRTKKLYEELDKLEAK